MCRSVGQWVNRESEVMGSIRGGVSLQRPESVRGIQNGLQTDSGQTATSAGFQDPTIFLNFDAQEKCHAGGPV